MPSAMGSPESLAATWASASMRTATSGTTARTEATDVRPIRGLHRPTTDLSPPMSCLFRGPGSGVVGYCLIGPTVGGPTSPAGATTPYPVTNPNKPGTTLNGGQGTLRGGTLAASQRTINIQVTPLPNPRVIVQIQYVTGGPWITELNAAAPPNTPSTYKFGLSASTGGSNDIHLVRATEVRTINHLPDLQLEKQVDRSGTSLPAIITAGTVIPYQYTVTNVGAPVDTLSITDEQDRRRRRSGATVRPSATAPAQGSTTVCRGTYTVTAADVLAIQRVDNVATAHAKVAPAGLDVASPPVRGDRTAPLDPHDRQAGDYSGALLRSAPTSPISTRSPTPAARS